MLAIEDSELQCIAGCYLPLSAERYSPNCNVSLRADKGVKTFSSSNICLSPPFTRWQGAAPRVRRVCVLRSWRWREGDSRLKVRDVEVEI